MTMKRANRRPRLRPPDRLFWIAFRRVWRNCYTASDCFDPGANKQDATALDRDVLDRLHGQQLRLKEPARKGRQDDRRETDRGGIDQ